MNSNECKLQNLQKKSGSLEVEVWGEQALALRTCSVEDGAAGFNIGKREKLTKKLPGTAVVQNKNFMHASFSNGTLGQFLGQYWGCFWAK